NHLAIAPGSVVNYVGNGTDSVNGCFNWRPSVLDIGLKLFVISVQACDPQSNNPPITQSFTIPIYIWPVPVASNDTTICINDSAALNVIGGGNFQWTVLPGGDPVTSLSCTNCSDPVATPTQTTTYVVTSTVNNFCLRNTDTVTVTVVRGPVIDVGPDITTCIGETVQLDINLVPDPGTTYNILWSPNTYLNSDTVANPLSTPTNDITY